MVFEDVDKVDSSNKVDIDGVDGNHIAYAFGQGNWYVLVTDESMGEAHLEDVLEKGGYSVSAVYRGDHIFDEYHDAYSAAVEFCNLSVDRGSGRLFLVDY